LSWWICVLKYDFPLRALESLGNAKNQLAQIIFESIRDVT